MIEQIQCVLPRKSLVVRETNPSRRRCLVIHVRESCEKSISFHFKFHSISDLPRFAFGTETVSDFPLFLNVISGWRGVHKNNRVVTSLLGQPLRRVFQSNATTYHQQKPIMQLWQQVSQKN